MGRFVVVGERALVASYALAGADVIVAEEPEDVRGVWERLPEAASVVILTPMASRALTGAVLPADVLVLGMPT